MSTPGLSLIYGASPSISAGLAIQAHDIRNGRHPGLTGRTVQVFFCDRKEHFYFNYFSFIDPTRPQNVTCNYEKERRSGLPRAYLKIHKDCDHTADLPNLPTLKECGVMLLDSMMIPSQVPLSEIKGQFEKWTKWQDYKVEYQR